MRPHAERDQEPDGKPTERSSTGDNPEKGLAKAVIASRSIEFPFGDRL